MKQIAQNYKSGELAVLDVPAPTCRPGGVLVRSLFSLISTGTEMMKVSEASMSMVGMARSRPDQVRKVLDAASSAEDVWLFSSADAIHIVLQAVFGDTQSKEGAPDKQVTASVR